MEYRQLGRSGLRVSTLTLADPASRAGRRNPRQEQITHLERENRRLEQELAKARSVADVQAKLHAPLETEALSARTSARLGPGAHCDRSGVD